MEAEARARREAEERAIRLAEEQASNLRCSPLIPPDLPLSSLISESRDSARRGAGTNAGGGAGAA